MDTLTIYHRALNRLPGPLPREMEALATRDELVTANLAFAFQIANEYKGRGIPLPDLVQLANVGLIEAANRFDPGRGIKFISYAVWWIMQPILEAFRDNGPVHIPRNQTDRGVRLTYETLDVPAQVDKENGQTRKDLVPDEGPGPDREAEDAALVAFVAAALSRLPEPDRTILALHFGLNGPEHTMADIGRRMGLSKERVRQIKDRALRRLW